MSDHNDRQSVLPASPGAGAGGLSEEQVRLGERMFLIETGLVRAMMASVTGLFLTGLVVELGGEVEHVGAMRSAMLLGGAFQIASNSVLTRLGSRKRFCLITLGVVRVLRLVIAALPFMLLLDGRLNLIGPLGALLFLAGIFGMSAEVGRQSWIADLVPARVRGRFFGWRVFVAGAASMVFVGLYGWFVDAWREGGGEPLLAFQILIGFGAGAGFASLWFVWKAPEPVMHKTGRPTTFFESIRLPFRHDSFRWFVVAHASFSFAAGVCGWCFHYFMLQFLGMKYLWIAATDIVSNFVGLMAAPGWGRLADRWGTKRMLAVALTAKAIFPFLWLAVLPQWWYLVFAVVLVRVFNTAQQIGFINLGLNIAPAQDRAAYISVDRGLNNLAHAASPALAAVLAAAIGDHVWLIGAYQVTSLHVLIVISGVLRLSSLVWLRWVKEPPLPKSREVVADEDTSDD